MEKVKDATKGTRQHQIYKLADGTRVPGTTTVTGILDKPALVKWANNLGLQGIDSSKYVDEKARIGTLAHAMIEAYLKGEEIDTSEYSKVEIDQAETCLIKFWDWTNEHKIKPILCEVPLVSERYRYGGTIDCFGEVDGKPMLLDFKTGKGIFPEMLIQLAAYNQLLTENGHVPDGCRILRVGRNEEEGFEDRSVNSLAKRWELFTHCLAIYQIQKEIRKEG